ncbi:hypothetical protein GQ600_1467 [Phytophthora cactorum]|nr:hypothetical protein GQ600_1467 [Phytophthora cactorum]
MSTVLGPSAVNERKFTKWDERGCALGLNWDTEAGLVSIPTEKIEKAQRTIQSHLDSGKVANTELLSLLGCLRHIATCCPLLEHFTREFKALRQTCRGTVTDVLTPLQSTISSGSRQFSGTPIRSTTSLYLNSQPLPNPPCTSSWTHPMTGLCALEPTLRKSIRVQFTEAIKQ